MPGKTKRASVSMAATGRPEADGQRFPRVGATTRLVLRYYSVSQMAHRFQVSSLGGAEAQLRSSSREGCWTTAKFHIPECGADGYLGFTVTGDSAYGTDRRYVRAADGVAEAWLVDGDPRVFEQPIPLPLNAVLRRGLKAYLPVTALPGTLGVELSEGRNAYAFDGAPPGTLEILTIRRGRDCVDLSTATDRAGCNTSGTMPAEHADTAFRDIDGFAAHGTYYFSFDAVEALFHVGTLLTDAEAFVLPRARTAYDAVGAAASPESVGFSSGRLADLDGFITSQVEAGACTVSLSIVKDGKLVKESAYGYSRKYDTPFIDGAYRPARPLPPEEWEATHTDTLFDLASNTKMYSTNFAVQQLVSRGALDLDRTLQSFPGWEKFTDAYSVYSGKWTIGGTGGITARQVGKDAVTIRDILRHEAGLIPDPEYPNRLAAGELYHQNTDPADRSGIIDAISKTPLMYAPRTTFAYSDVDYLILGLLVEQLSGQRIDSYFADQIAGPLQLRRTIYAPLDHGFSRTSIAATELNGNTRDGNVTFGTLPGGAPVPLRCHTLQGEVHDEKAFHTMGQVAGHAGLFSTAGDMAVLTQLMLNDGIYNGQQLFTAEVVDAFTRPHAVDPAVPGSATTGLGWRVNSTIESSYHFTGGPGRSTYGHQGWTGTLTVIDPVANMTISLLGSVRHSPVVSPPNGFAGTAFPLADLVSLTARIYGALGKSSNQYSPLAVIAPVQPVSIPSGRPIKDALDALPISTTVTTSTGQRHTAQLVWSVDSYQGGRPGTFAATARVSLPAPVIQPAEPVELALSTTLTVYPEVPGAGS